jgi:pyrroline-5-carboxylate reductase
MIKGKFGIIGLGKMGGALALQAIHYVAPNQ